MCSLYPNILTLIYNADQYIGFVQPEHNIGDVQSTYPRVWLYLPSHSIQRFFKIFLTF